MKFFFFLKCTIKTYKNPGGECCWFSGGRSIRYMFFFLKVVVEVVGLMKLHTFSLSFLPASSK